MKETVKLNRLLAGILSLVLIALLIIGPLYLAERLMHIESQNGYEKYDEIINQDDTINYDPYLELNETNGFNNVVLFNDGANHVGTIFYNQIGYQEIIHGPVTGNDIKVYMFMKVDYTDLMLYNIPVIKLRINSSFNYTVYDYQIGANGVGTLSQTVPSEWNTWKTGDNTLLWEQSPMEMLNAVNYQEQVTTENRYVKFSIKFEYYETTPVYISIEYGPEYYQEVIEGGSFINETYKPVILTFSYYNVYKVMFGVGAVLVFGIGWIASPWGERLDPFLPINQYRGPLSRSKGKRHRRKGKR